MRAKWMALCVVCIACGSDDGGGGGGGAAGNGGAGTGGTGTGGTSTGGTSGNDSGVGGLPTGGSSGSDGATGGTAGTATGGAAGTPAGGAAGSGTGGTAGATGGTGGAGGSAGSTGGNGGTGGSTGGNGGTGGSCSAPPDLTSVSCNGSGNLKLTGYTPVVAFTVGAAIAPATCTFANSITQAVQANGTVIMGVPSSVGCVQHRVCNYDNSCTTDYSPGKVISRCFTGSDITCSAIP